MATGTIKKTLVMDSVLTGVTGANIKCVCGDASVTVNNANYGVAQLSTITGGAITNNSKIVAISAYTLDTSHIVTGARTSANSANIVFGFEVTVSGTFNIRFIIFYYD